MIVRIVVAVLLLALLFVLVEFAPLPLLLAAASGVLLIAVREMANLVGHFDCPIYSPTYLLTAALPWLWTYLPQQRLEILLAILFVLLGVWVDVA